MTKKISTFYLIIAGVIILCVASGVLYNKYFKKECRDEQISKLHEKYFYLNLSKEVSYTGDEKCKSCHSDITESFHKTGMGSSFYKLSGNNEIEDFTKENTIYDAKLNYYYQVYKKDNEYFQKEFRKDDAGKIIHELDRKIEYVIGSGNNTRSYLYSENGFYYEMPVSWYTEKAKWDLSPGYEKFNLRFSRPIIQECMNCHNGYSDFTEFSENKFHSLPEGINCERCHGPGELHIKRQTEKSDLFEAIEKDSIDRTIVNPANLPIEEKLSVCYQCHLQGDVRVFTEDKSQTDFKPGMKLSDVKTVFVQDNVHKGDFKIASHAARMSLCDCFIKSEGKMTCITCHDPHKSVKDVSREFFNSKCISCHNTNTLSVSKFKVDHRPESDCISCHMKQGGTKDVQHVNFTDHWIRKEIETPDRQPEENISHVKLKNFNNPGDKFADMNLGIAYVKYYDTKHPDKEYLQTAIPMLEENLKKFPEHKEGLYHLGLAYLKSDKTPEAVSTLQKLTSIDTGNAPAYFLLGTAFEKLKNTRMAIESYENSLKYFPENVKAYNSLGNLYYNTGKINEAIGAYKKAISIISNNPAVLNNLGDIYLYKLNQLDEAKKFLNMALELDPDFAMALNNLGNAFMIEGKTQEAEAIFKEVIGKDRANVMAYGNLAVIYEDKGNIAMATDMLHKILLIDPNDVRAKQMMKRLGK
ncbi:MAG: tetratricopeptide repeat protein [Ignavibacteria bacterium]